MVVNYTKCKTCGKIDDKCKHAESSIEYCSFDLTNIYLNDDIDKLSKVAIWGSYGKDGKGKKRMRNLIDLDTEHIKAILRTQKNISYIYKEAFNYILKQRRASNIKQILLT